MKRIQYHQYGGPQELRLEEVPTPEPARNQARVRVRAAGANPMDSKIRRGEVKMMTGNRFPRGLGHDFAGVVEAVGSEVKRLKVGDEVFGATTLKEAGAFADVVITSEDHILPKPTSVPFEQAGAMTITSVTAWTALVDKAKVRAGQAVFIAGCLGGVGRAAVQVALLRGALVTGSCNADRRDEALALGVREVVDYRGFHAAAYRGRFDVVFDTNGALSFPDCGVMLKTGGVSLHIVPTPLKMLQGLISPKHKVVFANPKADSLAGLLAAIAEGKVTAEIGRVTPLSEAIPAILELETTGSPKGKLVIVP